jgi:hypothetical protein
MFDLLRRLLGSDDLADQKSGLSHAPSPQDVQPQMSAKASDSGGEHLIREYFELHEKIEHTKKAGDYYGAISYARQTYRILPAFVDAWKQQHGSFGIVTSVAVEAGRTLMPAVGEREGIAELRLALQERPELYPWISIADAASVDADLVGAILDRVAQEPGILQTDVKNRLVDADGRKIANLLYWLEQVGRLRRERQGRSYRVFLSSGERSQPMDSNKPAPPPFPRRNGRTKCPRQMDLASVTYIPLPKAPPAWERRDTRDEVQTNDARHLPRFTLTGEGNWKLRSESKLLPDERPEGSFKHMHLTEGAVLFVDPGGKESAGRSRAAVLQSRDHRGRLVAERNLKYDVYRTGVSPRGHGIIFMSRECVVHAYADELHGVVEASLREIPELCACVNRLQIAPDELKNHVRCVALSADSSQYLFTIVDEAWCISTSGEVLWGVRMPVASGWSKISSRTGRSATAIQLEDALRFMDLWYPVTSDDIKHRYRVLAKRWHPDLNPTDPQAHANMRSLNAAAEVLTGADAVLLAAPDSAPGYFERDTRKTQFEVQGVGTVTVSFGMVASEKQAADWIYAVSFAAGDNRTFLASYSGRIVEVAAGGNPLRVYDIGAVPIRIAETYDYLYILTDTRLYIIAQEKLHALIDVFDHCTLLLAETGFGLLGQKQLALFGPNGRALGAVHTRDPIRRVYSTVDGLVIETRQHRAVIDGPPLWWST